ncbi:hypothetical protein SAMN04489760_110114 [Syntrophus gentianae]|uniref:Uncharacterized protein n=1 Tax=Syntrophus gentianae TaxID=43775 RepID=A0A1H7XGM0_9BACT|nr:hypothetical protein [Syntrophus gentianae]SEM32946.1 hypothetical protein SAMN04489760_110114 [Syntrophus gentianae]
MAESLGEALPKQQARVREILGHNKAIGTPGIFGTLMIEHSLREADKAVISGDPVAMLRAYEDLKNIKE